MALPHLLKRIRLELARSKDFPMGSARHGYEFVAPRLSPVAGAALYAAKLAGAELSAESVARLARSAEGCVPGDVA